MNSVGAPLCVHNMEVSVFQGLLGGVVICNWGDLSIGVRCCERLAR